MNLFICIYFVHMAGAVCSSAARGARVPGAGAEPVAEPCPGAHRHPGHAQGPGPGAPHPGGPRAAGWPAGWLAGLDG